MFSVFSDDIVIKDDELIGIFDIDSTTASRKSNRFFEVLENNKKVTVKSDGSRLPKSFIMTGKTAEDTEVILSGFSALVLKERISKEIKGKNIYYKKDSGGKK